jgi:hypothetical protein
VTVRGPRRRRCGTSETSAGERKLVPLSPTRCTTLPAFTARLTCAWSLARRLGTRSLTVGWENAIGQAWRISDGATAIRIERVRTSRCVRGSRVGSDDVMPSGSVSGRVVGCVWDLDVDAQVLAEQGFEGCAVDEFDAAVFAGELPTALAEPGCRHEDCLARVAVLAQYACEGWDGVGLDAFGIALGLDDAVAAEQWVLSDQDRLDALVARPAGVSRVDAAHLDICRTRCSKSSGFNVDRSEFGPSPEAMSRPWISEYRERRRRKPCIARLMWSAHRWWVGIRPGAVFLSRTRQGTCFGRPLEKIAPRRRGRCCGGCLAVGARGVLDGVFAVVSCGRGQGDVGESVA